MTLVCLLGYGLTVSWLAPGLLRRLVALGVSPRLAVAAWSAATGSAVISWWVSAYDATVTHHGAPTAVAWLAVVVLVTGRLALSIGSALMKASRQRSEHLSGLHLVGRPSRRLGATIVDWPQPLVYCLPARPGVVVISSAALRVLSARQLRAVLEHERAHLDGGHATITTVAHGVSRALPQLPLFAQFGRHIAGLLEMCADDRAARRFGRRTVAQALGAMAPVSIPAGALGMAGASVVERAQRLVETRSQGRRWLATGVTLLAFAAFTTGPYLHLVAPWCAGE
jgi:Zn-dependent protease with chaperone function